jgi:Uma2 family endonuclease
MALTTPIPVTWWDEFEPPEGVRAEIIDGELVMSPTAAIPMDWWDQFEPPEGLRAEIIRGELVLSPSASRAHAFVQWRVQQALALAAPPGYGPISGLEWRLANEPIVASAPVPDVMVVAEAGDLAPLLAVEILSPSDKRRLRDGMTRIEGKRADYAAHGLAHYLEIDLALRTVEVYRLENGSLTSLAVARGSEEVRVPEPFPYRLVLDDLFREITQ